MINAEQAAESIPITDWIAMVCSAIAALFALVTVVTVYVAARQLLTEHRAYQIGLSQQALGPWHDKVKTGHLLGLQQTIATPVISVPLLLKQEWRPEFIFPTGFEPSDSQSDPHVRNGPAQPRWAGFLRALRLKPREDGNLYAPIDAEKASARASWVNFVQALNVQPQDDRFYRMEAQSTLVNGIVPMRWVGKDLCGTGSILGFQSYERTPSVRDPMPLPMQWSGPIGWLQFRSSAEGCVVEFRRRAMFDNQLSNALHDYCRELPRYHEAHFLIARLWWSVSSLALKDGKALYLGTLEEDLEEERGRLELLVSCPGLLSTDFEGQLANSRGLDIKKCSEYRRIYVHTMSEAEQERFQFSLGNLRMDKFLLSQIKEAVGLLKPDGYYFTPVATLDFDLLEILHAVVQSCGSKKQRIFPFRKLSDWPKDNEHKDQLYHAMMLCNEFQHISSNGRGNFTISDMVVVAKTSYTLRATMRPPADLFWAMVISPELYTDVAEAFEKLLRFDSLDRMVRCENEVLDCTEILRDHIVRQNGDGTVRTAYTYKTPLCANGQYTGWQLLAAFTDLMVTYLWFNKSWISDVGRYDNVIPQTVTMC